MGKRALTGESIFMTHFTNQGWERRVSFAAPYPGKIICVDLPEHQNSILCQKTLFSVPPWAHKLDCLSKETRSRFLWRRRFHSTKIDGKWEGIHSCRGTIVKKQLNGESLRVDTGCIVAFEESVNYDVEMAGRLKSMVFGGEGMFLATLRGFGTVW